MPDSLEPVDQRLPKRRDLSVRPAGGDVLVRDAANGTVHFLNPTAAVVWDCCDGQTAVSACAARIRASFAIKPDTDLTADIREIVQGFERLGLLTKDLSDAE